MESQLLPYATAASELQKRLFSIIETCHATLEACPVPLPEPSADLTQFDVAYHSSLPQYLDQLKAVQASLHQTQRAIIRADKWVTKFRQENTIPHSGCVLESMDPDQVVIRDDPVLDNCCFWCITRLLPENIIEWVDWLRVVLQNITKSVEGNLHDDSSSSAGNAPTHDAPRKPQGKSIYSAKETPKQSVSPSTSEASSSSSHEHPVPPPTAPVIPQIESKQPPPPPPTSTTTTANSPPPTPNTTMDIDDDFSFDVAIPTSSSSPPHPPSSSLPSSQIASSFPPSLSSSPSSPLSSSLSPQPTDEQLDKQLGDGTPSHSQSIPSPPSYQHPHVAAPPTQQLQLLRDQYTTLQTQHQQLKTHHDDTQRRLNTTIEQLHTQLDTQQQRITQLLREKEQLVNELEAQRKMATTHTNTITQLEQKVQQQQQQLQQLQQQQQQQQQQYPGWFNNGDHPTDHPLHDASMAGGQPKSSKYPRIGSNNVHETGNYYPPQQQHQQQTLPDGFTTASRYNRQPTGAPSTPSTSSSSSSASTTTTPSTTQPGKPPPPRLGLKKFQPPQPIAPSQNKAARNILNDNPNYYEDLQRQQQQQQQQQQYGGKTLPPPPPQPYSHAYQQQPQQQPQQPYQQNRNPNAAIANNTSINPAIKRALLHNPNSNNNNATNNQKNNNNNINTGGGQQQGPNSNNNTNSNTNNNGEQRTHIGCIELNPDGSLPEPLQGLDIALVESVMNDMLNTDTGVQWSDIAGLNHCKQAIKECLIWPLMRPELFQGLRDPPTGMLLFGPPGTGKTMLGKAIANQCNAHFFSVSASSLTSKWYGQGEKLVRTLFTICRYLSPCVLFMDEVDSVMGSRSEGENDALRRLKTELLVQMDGLTNSGNSTQQNAGGIGVIVIAATNLPQELDDAARRRLVKRVYVPLPGFLARRQLIEILLKKEQHNLQPSDIDWVANKTREYSASDIKQLCVEAAFVQLRRSLQASSCNSQQHNASSSMSPTSSLSSSTTTTGGGHNDVSMSNYNDLDSIQLRPVTLDDFETALQSIRPSVNMDSIEGYYKWNDLYGSYRIPPAEDDEVNPSILPDSTTPTTTTASPSSSTSTSTSIGSTKPIDV